MNVKILAYIRSNAAPTGADERTPLEPAQISAWRAPHEALVQAAASPNAALGGRSAGDSSTAAAPRHPLRHAQGRAERARARGGRRPQPLAAGLRPRRRRFLRARARVARRLGRLLRDGRGGGARGRHRAGAGGRTSTRRRTSGSCPSPRRARSSARNADALALDQVVHGPRARAPGWTPTMRGITGNAPRLFEEYRPRRESRMTDLQRAPCRGGRSTLSRPRRASEGRAGAAGRAAGLDRCSPPAPSTAARGRRGRPASASRHRRLRRRAGLRLGRGDGRLDPHHRRRRA